MLNKFLSFMNSLGTIILVASTVSVLNRSIDTLIEKAIKTHPNSRALKAVDKVFDVSDQALEFVAQTLTRILIRRNEVPK